MYDETNEGINMQYYLINNAFQMQTGDGLGIVQFEGITLTCNDPSLSAPLNH